MASTDVYVGYNTVTPVPYTITTTTGTAIHGGYVPLSIQNANYSPIPVHQCPECGVFFGPNMLPPPKVCKEYCENCEGQIEDHADDGSCLFSPTKLSKVKLLHFK